MYSVIEVWNGADVFWESARDVGAGSEITIGFAEDPVVSNRSEVWKREAAAEVWAVGPDVLGEAEDSRPRDVCSTFLGDVEVIGAWAAGGAVFVRRCYEYM